MNYQSGAIPSVRTGPTDEVNRRRYLDGLRGVAAVTVLFGHIIIALASPVVTLSGGSPDLIALGKSPLAILWMGNAGVCIFFVLSGYVISELAQRSSLSFSAQVVRRYVRLAFPILLTSTFAWALLRAGLMANRDAAQVTHSGWLSMWYQFGPSLREMIGESLYRTFVDGSNKYNCNLWTMNIELAGSLLVFVLNSAVADRRQRALCYLGTCLLFPTGYLPLFVVGALLHDFEPEMAAWGSHLSAKGRYWLPLALFMGGLYLCSIQASAPGTYMPWHFFLPRFHGDNERYWHSIGAVMIMGGLLHSDGLQKIFGSKPARFLGDISFTLYLIHIPILCSLTSWLILWLQGYGRVGGAAITAFVTVAVVIGVSAALSRYVDGGAIRISRAAGRWWMTLPFVDKSNAVDGLLAER